MNPLSLEAIALEQKQAVLLPFAQKGNTNSQMQCRDIERRLKIIRQQLKRKPVIGRTK